MAFTYQAVVDFMDRYFKTFSRYGQDLENMHRMSEYFDSELEFEQYYPDTPHIHSLENFHKLNDHPDIHETLTPELLVIDTEKKIASVLVNVNVKDTHSGETFLTPKYNCIYYFKEYQDGSFKILKMSLFVEHSPEYAEFMTRLPKG